MTKTELKGRIYAAIDARAETIVAIGERIRRHPELGFKEHRTARLVDETLQSLGLTTKTGLASTGVRSELAGRRSGPTFAILGELDGLVVAGHAEEGGDLEWRVGQRATGALELLGGKQELLRLGHFDDVDLAMMIHTSSRAEDGKAGVPLSNNGRVGKTVRYVGRAAHAGGAPHAGINALYAAHIGLMAINAVRETFRDDDTIRVHPIMTHGGSQVNVIPGEARLETYVRGRTLEGVLDANAKVDRALKAGALALGARVEIETLPGYLPLRCDATMARYFKANAADLVGAEHYREIGHRAASTDMGDLSQVIPILHPYMGGALGTGHAADYAIADPALAYVAPAKALAAMVVDLLWDDASGAREVLAHAAPGLTRDRYLALHRDVAKREVYEGK